MRVLSTAVLAAMAASGASAAAVDTSSPMLTEALELMARASSTSEVLTLNLTNLLILLVLKALIFGFGLFSFGTTAAASARSADSSSPLSLTESDVTGGLCFINYMSGNEAKFDCIRRSACEDPKTGNDYLTAAKMWYKMHALVK